LAALRHGLQPATAPTFAKYNYPQLTQACVTDQGPALVKGHPGFHVPVVDLAHAKGAIGVLRSSEQRPDRQTVAVVTGDDFGIELANAGPPSSRPASKSSMTSPIRSAPRTTRR
jgi:hypothetical protein